MLLKILRRAANTFSGSCFNKAEEMLSSPEAMDFREEIKPVIVVEVV